MSSRLRFRSLILSLGIGVFVANSALGSFVLDFKPGSDAVNDNGPNTGTIIIKGTASGDQVVNATGVGNPLGELGSMGINLEIDLLGDLDGQSVNLTATPLVPFVAPSFFGLQTQTVNDGGTFTLAVVDLPPSGGASSPTFSSLLGGGNMIDLWEIEIVPNGPVDPTTDFVQGVNNSTVSMTLVGGSLPAATAVGPIGNPGSTDPLLGIQFGSLPGGATGSLTVAVPEPSSFAFLAMVGVLGGVLRKRHYLNYTG